MGIPAILAAAMKQISWGQVANIAIQYGPDFLRRIRKRAEKRPAEQVDAAEAVRELGERVRELEIALVKQEEILEQQNRSIELLQEIGKTLQARLNIFMALSAVLAAVLFILLLNR